MHDGTDAFVLTMFAWFAAFGFVAQTLVSEKELFAGCKNKFLSTFNTRESFIVVFDHGGSPRDSVNLRAGLSVQPKFVIFQTVAQLSRSSSTVQQPSERTRSRDNARE